jgi:AraC family transcriptional regulator, regulatory protein of adaptative response / DNA-3-methyladenine glycosylase II
VAGALTLAGGIVARCGQPLSEPLAEDGGLTHLFPEPAAIADADLMAVAVPAARRDALSNLARALADGEIALDPGAEREEAERQLVALHGIGAWTASYVAMRALGDPDAFLPTDLGVRRALVRLGQPGDPPSATALAERWRPWRAYAVQHLWAAQKHLPMTKKPATKKEVVA